MANPIAPYRESSANLIYNLLFCDSLELYKANTPPPHTHPFDLLFSESSSVSDLQTLIDEPDTDPRIKVLAYNRQLALGHQPDTKELLAVIVEVGLEEGLDTLATFANGTARYINQTGKILIWENAADENFNKLARELFAHSKTIVAKIGPWDQPRRPQPTPDTVRITFLVSDGLYFGEGPIDVLFNDTLAGPALGSATEILQFLTDQG